MAIDLGAANSTRYFTIPDHADLTFPDGDWFLAFWTNVNNNSGSTFQYIFSNNTINAANSLNIFLIGDGWGDATINEWRVNTDTYSQNSTAATGADNKNRLMVVQRNSGNLEMWFAEPNVTASKQLDAVYSDGAINGGDWYFGSRNDVSTTRMYDNVFGDLIKGTVALTQAQIELLALGVMPTLVTDYSNLDVWFPFRENAATVVDLINGHVATRQGTGLVTVEHFPVVSGHASYIPFTPGAGGTILPFRMRY